MAGGPKVFIFILDDAGFDFECVGHSFAITPAIDWLAANGRIYNNYSVASPICSTSRAAMLTGRTNHFTNIYVADAPLKNERAWLQSGAFTMPRMVKSTSVDVRTAFFGKWHLGDPGPRDSGPNRNTLSPMGFGFDYVFGNLYGLPSMPWDEYSSYQDAYVFEQNRENPVPLEYQQTEGFLTDVEFDRVLAKLEEWQDRPLLFWHGVNAPHEPLSTGVAQAALYPSNTLAEKTYYGSISNFDVNLQRLIDKVFELEIEDEVLIIVTSDNGPIPNTDAEHPYSVGSTGGRYGGKTSLWRGGAEVPLIVWGPGLGITAGSTDNDYRWGLDLLPTVAEIYGFDVSGGGYEGQSLLSAASPRDFFWSMEENATFFGTQSGNYAMVRTVGDGRRIKLIKWGDLTDPTDNTDNRFYDISSIPGEPTTLSLVPSSPGAGELLQSDADSMVAAWDAWWATRPAHISTTGNPTQSAPATEAEAVAYLNGILAQYPDEDYGYHCHMCGNTSELNALEATFATLVGFPHAIGCEHNVAGVAETAIGAFERGTNQFYGTSLLVPPKLMQMCLDPAHRANLSAPQLATVNARLARTSSNMQGGK